MKTNRSLLSMTLAMCIFGTIGIFRRSIPLGSSALAMTRGFVGTAFLLLILRLQGKKLDRQAIRRNLLLLVISGALIGVNWILLFEAYHYTTVAIATLCYYMAPIFVMLVSPLALNEAMTLKKILCVLVALIGMVFVSGVAGAERGSVDFRGVLLGLAAAVLYACVVVMNKKIQNIPAYDRTIVQLCSAGTVLLPYVLLTDTTGLSGMTPVSYLLVLVVCIVHTGVAYSLYFGSMEHLRAQTVALFAYIDPVVAILLSSFLLGEALGASGLIGALLVLGSTIVSELPGRQKTK